MLYGDLKPQDGTSAAQPQDSLPGVEAGSYTKDQDLDLALVGDDSSIADREIL
jgi:hypothetical protein